MGFPPFFSRGSGAADEEDVANLKLYQSPPEPQPHRFSIRATKQRGPYLLALVHYPDATTFNGEKLLVYLTSSSEFWEREKVDPHFLGVNGDPIARFPPTMQGREMAELFIQGLLERDRKNQDV